jgi:hypothetical protein
VNGVFSGYVDAGTTIHSTGRGTFDGGVTSADVKSRTLSVGYDSVYIDANNIMGKSPSALRFKQDVQPYTYDPTIVDRMQGYTFRLIEAVNILGDQAEIEHGYISDYLADIGLGDFARVDADGRFSGIAYERMIVPVADSLKATRAELRQVQTELGEARADIAALKGALGL